MLIEILNIATSGFWQFIAVICILCIPFKFVIKLWVGYMKMLTVKNHGYPPAHCDALGNAHDEDDDE
jgi:hypothetical protein